MQWSETKHCRLRSFYDMMVPVIEMKEKKKDPISSVRTKCIQLDASGKGLVKIKDEKVLIENLLPGEEVELEYTRGRGVRVVSAVRLTDSPLRVKPRCRVFDRCGGCQLQHVDYPAQLDWKKEKSSPGFMRRTAISWSRIRHAGSRIRSQRKFSPRYAS